MVTWVSKCMAVSCAVRAGTRGTALLQGRRGAVGEKNYYFHGGSKIQNSSLRRSLVSGNMSFSTWTSAVQQLSESFRTFSMRAEVRNPRDRDFTHPKTQKSVWLNSKLNSSRVEAELSAIAPGALKPNIFPWNAKLERYVKARQYQKTLDLFHQMQREGMKLNTFTFVPVLNACARLRALKTGQRIHRQIIRSGYDIDAYVGGSLIQMYVKCGNIDNAHRVFINMATRNRVAWNVMILAYVKCGQGEKALQLFLQMQHEGLEPDSVTFVGVLNACASIAALEEGKHVHKQIIERGCESNVFVGNSLVDMYTKCGSIEDALRAFNKLSTPDVVSWTAIILGYLKIGQGQKALQISQQMQKEGVDPDPVTFVGMLNACASVRALEEGRCVHEQIIQSGCDSDVFIGNSLIDMYAKCGTIEDAWDVFTKMPERDVVTWTSMIHGYVKCGQGRKALELYWKMQQERVDPDAVTFVAVLNACASEAALEEGKRVHEQINLSGCDSHMFVRNSLVDMYAKCGSIEDAQTVFNEIVTRDVITWTVMLAGYAMHGLGNEALRLFNKMCQASIEMDKITFVSLLSACSHAGLVDEGLHYFESMSSLYGITVTQEHFACKVDLLGRAGRLQEAEDVIKMMPCTSNTFVWMSLLGACRVHSNVEMGEKIAKHILKLDPGNAAGYVLLSNIYAAAGKWESSANLQQRLESSVKKQLGPAWIR